MNSFSLALIAIVTVPWVKACNYEFIMSKLLYPIVNYKKGIK